MNRMAVNLKQGQHVIMLHCEVYYDNQANPNEAELIIAKNGREATGQPD